MKKVNFLGIFAGCMRSLNARIPYNWEFDVFVNFACHSVVFGISVFNFQCCHNNILFKEY